MRTSFAPVCDFCAAGTPSVGYLVGQFKIVFPDTDPEPGSFMINSPGVWCACAICAPIIGADRLSDLVERIVYLMRTRYGPDFGERAVAVQRARQRQLCGMVLRMRSEAIALDDPRVAGMMLPDDAASMGVFIEPATVAGVQGHVVVSIPRAARHPDAP